jgi:hypothetical protein
LDDKGAGKAGSGGLAADTQTSRKRENSGGLFFFFVAEGGLKVLAAIEDTFDKHGVRRDNKRDRNAPLEAGHTQSRQNIVALCATIGKGCKPVAEIDDATDIAIGAIFVRVDSYIVMKLFKLSLGKRCENDIH